jgi:hypothetical protein
MLRVAGSHALHLFTEALLGLAGVLVIAGCILVWRLAQGPLDITTLVQREQFLLPTGGAHLTIGSAALAWEGFHDPDSPLDIRFSDLRIADAAGMPLARFPAGRVTLAAAPLWHGAVLPRTVVLRGAAVTLHRSADGVVRLDLDTAGAPPRRTTPLLARLTRPGAFPFLDQLQLVRLEHPAVSLNDAALGVLWHADAPDFVAHRQGSGTITGDGVLHLAVGHVRADVAARIVLSQAGADITARSVNPLSPAAVARAVPAAAAVAGIDAPVSADLAAHFDAGLTLQAATLSLQAGAGVLHAGAGSVTLASAAALIRTDGRETSLDNVRIALAPARGAHGAGPVLTGQATLARNAQGLRAGFALAIDHAAFADLPSYWPRGTSDGAQQWITTNITGGMAQNARVQGALEAAPDGTGLRLTSLSGSLDGHDITLHWLRPLPPIEHAEARLFIDGPDALHIDIPRGVQGPLALSDGAVRITGLSARDQEARITTRIDGALPDVLFLLNQPRLHLLSRQPFALQNAAGAVGAKLDVRLPLDARATFAQIGISATAKLSAVHLASIAAGRDLDGANLDLAVDTDHLDLSGTGQLGGVPAHLGLTMDFRAGGPAQTTTRVTATGRATARELATSWLPAEIVTGGTVGFDITYALLRDGAASVALALDAGQAAIKTPFGWTKPAGPAAQASARLELLHDQFAGIDGIAASGPGLKLASHLQAAGGRASTLVLDQLHLGRTIAHGSIGFPVSFPVSLPGGVPGRTDKRWRVTLRGSVLDLSSYLKQRDSANSGDSASDETRGPPWHADIAFDQVVLTRDETLAPVMLQADDDGLHYTHLALSAGGAGTPAQAHASIDPVAGGRKLTIDATDAGAVLLAAGIADNIRGGRLKLDGKFDDTAPHAPLTGQARLDQFRVTDAPAIGRLLKAMTLYGAGDLLRGPGLGFAAAVVPFGWQQRVLTLHNARAFSASLGLTAQGDVDLRHHTANLTGTIVPAYFFNQLLGKIPLLGKLFSPETGGGVFAARYSVRGPLKDPKVGINPLSALTPGFLRGVFGAL